jgi:[ribosomal protein S18]-alanine N-acetyltransferase
MPDGTTTTMPILIAPMRRRHLRGVIAIEQQTNLRPWSLGLFMGELRMPTSRAYVVALDRHHVVGYSGLMVTGDEGHITNVAVHPDFRRLGIAARMMLTTMREAIDRGVEAVTLEVRSSNAAAQELYRRFGFAPGGIRRNYYAELGEDALIMWAHEVNGTAYRERLERIESELTATRGRGGSA